MFGLETIKVLNEFEHIKALKTEGTTKNLLDTWNNTIILPNSNNIKFYDFRNISDFTEWLNDLTKTYPTILKHTNKIYLVSLQTMLRISENLIQQ